MAINQKLRPKRLNLSTKRKSRKLLLKRIRRKTNVILRNLYHDHDYLSLPEKQSSSVMVRYAGIEQMKEEKQSSSEMVSNTGIKQMIEEEQSSAEMVSNAGIKQMTEEEALPELEVESTVSNTLKVGHFGHSEISLEGRRVVDIGHLFRELVKIGKHPPFDCSFEHMYPIKEKRVGLNSTILFKCRMCNIVKSVGLCDTTNDLDVNKALVLGSIAMGSGFTGSEELFTAMNIPFMAAQTFYKHQETVADAVHVVAWNTIEDAGKEEAEMAKSLGEVNEDGIPLITVVADGAWSKRSYSTNYNAKSGVACIIGARTRKILFLAVRNKYCCICSRAESKHMEIPVHKCYKNWSTTSTSMESGIILEGFNKSIEMHGVIFKRLVGDGDSSIYIKLSESKPYGSTMVEKIQCRNHLLRNFSKKIRDICGRKRSNSKNLPVVPGLRKLLEKSAMRLRTAIRYAILHRVNEDATHTEKVENLKRDLSNVTSHVFGEHRICTELGYFNCNKKATESNHIPAMKDCGLFSDIEVCFNRLICNAHSLIINMDTNIAEQYNSIVCKFVGGKRINFSGRRSYITRCESAAISFNTKGNYLSSVYEELAQTAPCFIKKHSAKMTRRRELRSKRPLRKKRKTVALPDKDYGPEANQ